MPPDWFRPRGYRHFDRAVGASFAAKVMEPGFVKRHSWSPLISYVKREKRYKPDLRRTVFKDRSIMYASHRDACILSRYAHEVTARLDERYSQHGLDGAVIAYRKLGKLRQRFLPSGIRNFSSYARRAAKTMKSKRIVGQVRRLERMVEQAIRDLNK